MIEEWKTIPNYENLYEISNLGRVKRLSRNVTRRDGRICPIPEAILSVTPNTRVSYVILYKNNKLKNYSIIRLVAMAFIPEFTENHIIAKIDKTLGNTLDNIKLSSRSEIMTETWASKHSYVEDGRCHSTLKDEFLARGKTYKDTPSLGGEIWVPVIGYEKYYNISNFGRLKRLCRTVLLKDGRIKILPDRISHPYLDKKYGYPSFHLIGDDKSKRNNFVHRLIAIHFIPNPENKPYVNHKDGIKTNIKIENLEWVTNSENIIHAFENGLKKQRTCEAASQTKTTNKELAEILRLRDLGFSNTEVGEISGMGRKYVERVFRARKNGLDLTKRRTFQEVTKSRNIQYITEN